MHGTMNIKCNYGWPSEITDCEMTCCEKGLSQVALIQIQYSEGTYFSTSISLI